MSDFKQTISDVTPCTAPPSPITLPPCFSKPLGVKTTLCLNSQIMPISVLRKMGSQKIKEKKIKIDDSILENKENIKDLEFKLCRQAIELV